MLGSKPGRMKQVIFLNYYFMKFKLFSFEMSIFTCSPQLAVNHMKKKTKPKNGATPKLNLLLFVSAELGNWCFWWTLGLSSSGSEDGAPWPCAVGLA